MHHVSLQIGCLKVDVVTHAPCDKALDEKVCSRTVAENRISFPTLTMMKAVMKAPTRGATISLLARLRVVLTIIPAKRQNPHSGSEKYEKAPLVTAL
jgi:hypothetical protein